MSARGHWSRGPGRRGGHLRCRGRPCRRGGRGGGGAAEGVTASNDGRRRGDRYRRSPRCSRRSGPRSPAAARTWVLASTRFPRPFPRPPGPSPVSRLALIVTRRPVRVDAPSDGARDRYGRSSVSSKGVARSDLGAGSRAGALQTRGGASAAGIASRLRSSSRVRGRVAAIWERRSSPPGQPGGAARAARRRARRRFRSHARACRPRMREESGRTRRHWRGVARRSV